MKTGPAIADILKKEGVEYLFAYPVNHLIEACAAVDIRPIIVRQERIELPNDAYAEDVPEPLGYEPVVATKYGPDPAAVAEAAKVLMAAKRPVIYAGQGVHWAEAYAELKELAELLAIPVCTSLQGKSCFDETHRPALASGGRA